MRRVREGVVEMKGGKMDREEDEEEEESNERCWRPR